MMMMDKVAKGSYLSDFSINTEFSLLPFVHDCSYLLFDAGGRENSKL